MNIFLNFAIILDGSMDEFKKQRRIYSDISHYQTSSEIVMEAKEALASNRSTIMNTRIVKTNRPFTPKTNQRTLFEGIRSGRPTSSVR